MLVGREQGNKDMMVARKNMARASSNLTATACVFDLIHTTTAALIVSREPQVNKQALRYLNASRRARVLTKEDPTTLEIPGGSIGKDLEAQSRIASIQTKQEIADFEKKIRSGHENRRREVISESTALGAPDGVFQEARSRKEEDLTSWSADARALSELAMEKAGAGGAGPRVTVEEAYSHFQALDLSEREISMIDPGFVHFENLTELDIGRNRLRAVQNLPEGLVTLSCAANELSGRALEGVQTLAQLSTLDLSYNSLGDGSFGLAEEGEAPEEAWGRGGTYLDPRWGGGVELSTYDKFPELEFLDLSWNVLCDLGGILGALG